MPRISSFTETTAFMSPHNTCGAGGAGGAGFGDEQADRKIARLSSARLMARLLSRKPQSDDPLHDPMLASAGQSAPHPDIEVPARRRPDVEGRKDKVMLLGQRLEMLDG